MLESFYKFIYVVCYFVRVIGSLLVFLRLKMYWRIKFEGYFDLFVIFEDFGSFF